MRTTRFRRARRIWSCTQHWTLTVDETPSFLAILAASPTLTNARPFSMLHNRCRDKPSLRAAAAWVRSARVRSPTMNLANEGGPTNLRNTFLAGTSSSLVTCGVAGCLTWLVYTINMYTGRLPPQLPFVASLNASIIHWQRIRRESGDVVSCSTGIFWRRLRGDNSFNEGWTIKHGGHGLGAG